MYDDDDYWRKRDARDAQLEELKRQAAWAQALAAERAQVALVRSLSAPPKKKRPPKGSTPRAKALQSWRRRAARGLPDRCKRCRRKTIAHRGRGYCQTCYKVFNGDNKRWYARHKEDLMAWKAAHRDLCRLYSRRSGSTPAAKRKRNARLRRQRRERRAEELRVLRERNREERRRWLAET